MIIPVVDFKFEKYQNGDYTDYCIVYGNCNSLIPKIPINEIDLILTDPPYSMKMGGGGCFKDRKYLNDIKDTHLNVEVNTSFIKEYANWIMFCSKEQLVNTINMAENKHWVLITWNKTNPLPCLNNTYLPDTEYIVHCFQNGKNLYGDYKD